MKTLITGATGFLGSAVVRHATDAGLSVVATDLNPNVPNIVPADICDPHSLKDVLQDVDCVCHVAGLAHVFSNPEGSRNAFNTINVVGSENVGKAAAENGVKHIVLVSSVSVYGGVAKGIDEEHECCPCGPYAESKLKAEKVLRSICNDAGIGLSVLRLSTLYGEEDPGNVARLINSIDRRRFIWIGKGTNRKSLIHRDDAARACVTAIKGQIPGFNIYNVSGDASKMRQIVLAIERGLGKSTPSWYVPAAISLGIAKAFKILTAKRGRFGRFHGTLQKWLADDYYDVQKFSAAFNFRTIVSLEEGLLQETSWYQNTLVR